MSGLFVLLGSETDKRSETGGHMIAATAGYHLALRAAFASMLLLLALPQPGHAQSSRTEIARGKYLVGFGGCIDCHTPGYFFGKPDMPRALAGSEVGFEIPGLGVFYGPNLTSDKATGLGNWTKEQIVTALQKGTRPDGRQLAPIMPWRAFAGLTKNDANAIAAYLKTLQPVSNKVPGPFGPTEKPTSFIMRVVPAPDK